jgi:hypothetical protein
MQLAPGKDAGIGHADLLYLIQVEEPRTVRQGVQGHDADRGCVGIEDGESEHEGTTGCEAGWEQA